MKQLIDKLRHKHSLTGEEYAILLTCQDADTLMYLQQQAQEVTLAHFGNAIFIRGLIEVGNRCRNNCSLLRNKERKYRHYPLRIKARNHFGMLP